jgi:hypothetical protein
MQMDGYTVVWLQLLEPAVLVSINCGYNFLENISTTGCHVRALDDLAGAPGDSASLVENYTKQFECN